MIILAICNFAMAYASKLPCSDLSHLPSVTSMYPYGEYTDGLCVVGDLVTFVVGKNTSGDPVNVMPGVGV